MVLLELAVGNVLQVEVPHLHLLNAHLFSCIFLLAVPTPGSISGTQLVWRSECSAQVIMRSTKPNFVPPTRPAHCRLSDLRKQTCASYPLCLGLSDPARNRLGKCDQGQVGEENVDEEVTKEDQEVHLCIISLLPGPIYVHSLLMITPPFEAERGHVGTGV